MLVEKKPLRVMSKILENFFNTVPLSNAA